MTKRQAAMLPLLVLLFALAPAHADDMPPDAPAVPPADAPPVAEPAPVEPMVAVVKGHRVNLRVGPRIDVHPVTQLEEGEPVIIVERRLDWAAVLVPVGFPAAVSEGYLVAEGPDMVRVNANRLNLRACPPEPGKPAPGAFLDRVESGALLPLIEMIDPPERGVETDSEVPFEFGWAWVLAPESTRAFIHEDFLTVLGPLSEHQAIVDAARARRAIEVKRLAAARREQAARASGRLLMEILGTVQQDLYRLRLVGSLDKTPVVALANRMDRALDEEGTAAADVLALGRALREDLEREIQLRAARYDAELAKVRGLDAPAVPPLEEVEENATVTGEIHYEPTPGWKEDGIFLLFVDAKPRFVLEVGTGGPLPHPELERHVRAGGRRLRGRRAGRRLFGLPVFEVTHLEAVQ